MGKEERNVLVLRAVLFRSTLPYVVFFLFSPPAWLILLWPRIDIIYLLKCQTCRTLFWAQTRVGNRALANFRGWVWIRSRNIVFFYTYYTLQGSSSLRRSLWKCISDVFVMLEEHHWFSVSAAFQYNIHHSAIHSHLCHPDCGLCRANQIQSACRNNSSIVCGTPLCWRLYYSSPNLQRHRNTSESAGGPDTGSLRSIMPYLCLWVLCYILGACSRVKINAVNTALWMNKFPPRRHCSMAHR